MVFNHKKLVILQIYFNHNIFVKLMKNFKYKLDIIILIKIIRECNVKRFCKNGDVLNRCS